MRPEFSEREFEFCFNAEFIRKNTGAVIGTPFIPSQKLERLLGFDVEFRLRQGNIQYSLFLQHKVSHFISNRSGRNVNIYNFHGGPYYYFYLERLDKSPQHNLLYNLRQSGEEVYYSAPIFYKRNVFTQYFVNNVVIDNSVFIDPSSVGLITDFIHHKISYDQNGTRAAFHSESKEIEKPIKFSILKEKLKRKKIDEGYFNKLFLSLKEGVNEVYRAEFEMPKKYIELPIISQCAYLLRKYYRLQWVMF